MTLTDVEISWGLFKWLRSDEVIKAQWGCLTRKGALQSGASGMLFNTVSAFLAITCRIGPVSRNRRDLQPKEKTRRKFIF
jgi:hypothetical protein